MKSIMFGGMALLMASAVGCGPHLAQVTSPPVTRVAEQSFVPFDSDEIRLTKGVAVGFDCSDPWSGDACKAEAAILQDPTIARVLPAHLEREVSPWGGSRAREGLVLVGLSPGETILTVAGASGQSTFRVIVLAPTSPPSATE